MASVIVMAENTILLIVFFKFRTALNIKVEREQSLFFFFERELNFVGAVEQNDLSRR